MTKPTAWLALDVGGANIKGAHTLGMARTVPFELWKRPEALPGVLADFAAIFPTFDRIALTMTAELCDCYPIKAVGVRSILDATSEVSRGRPTHVWGTDGNFHAVADVRSRPEIAAAANWLALATLAARLVPNGPGILIDVGTTTTDLIPTRDGRPVPGGRSDTERLRTGELVYAGVRRTPVCALATDLVWRGGPTGLAAELFATTLDVYLTLGEVLPDPNDLATADGRPATVDAARDRLARMVGADRDGFSPDDALELAQSADAVLMTRLVSAAERTRHATLGQPIAAIVAGSGAFLARRLASRIVGPGGTIIDLDAAWGPIASTAGCAYALAVLAGEREGDG